MKRCKILCYSSILICTLLLSSCSAWLENEDWENYGIVLVEKYYITAPERDRVKFSKENDNISGVYQYLIPNCHVEAYYIHENYICISGIHTEAIQASDEELENGKIEYYLFNIETESLEGPYENFDTFEAHCNTKGFSVVDKWLLVVEHLEAVI